MRKNNKQLNKQISRIGQKDKKKKHPWSLCLIYDVTLLSCGCFNNNSACKSLTVKLEEDVLDANKTGDKSFITDCYY